MGHSCLRSLTLHLEATLALDIFFALGQGLSHGIAAWSSSSGSVRPGVTNGSRLIVICLVEAEGGALTVVVVEIFFLKLLMLLGRDLAWILCLLSGCLAKINLAKTECLWSRLSGAGDLILVRAEEVVQSVVGCRCALMGLPDFSLLSGVVVGD
jgi:hypothetical protein